MLSKNADGDRYNRLWVRRLRQWQNQANPRSADARRSLTRWNINDPYLFQGAHPFKCDQTFEMTTDPSPTAEATRFTDPALTSPTAKIPGCDVA